MGLDRPTGLVLAAGLAGIASAVLGSVTGAEALRDGLAIVAALALAAGAAAIWRPFLGPGGAEIDRAIPVEPPSAHGPSGDDPDRPVDDRHGARTAPPGPDDVWVRALYDLATEGAQITVFAQDRDLRYTWIHNPRLGLSVDEVVGRFEDDVIPAGPARDHILLHKRRVIATGKPETFEVEVPEGAATFWFRIDVTPLTGEGGHVSGIVCTAIDITRAKRLEEMRSDLSRRLGTTVQRFNLALHSTGVLVFSQDRDLRYTWANTVDSPLGDVVGKTDRDLFHGATLATVVGLKREAIATRTRQSAEIDVADGDATRRWVLNVEPEIGRDGEVQGVTCAALDVTERRRQEVHMRLAMREVTHRSKNLLAVVQAVARLTAQNVRTKDEFVESLADRLHALASTHDLLVAGDWGGADIADVVRGQVAPYAPQRQADRLIVEGPPVDLSAEAMQTLSLAVHELATNAAKYGALSNEVGTVSIRWRIDRSGDEPMLDLAWVERGGPPVAPPMRRGFGRIVVERNVAVSLAAKVDLAFRTEGVEAHFRIPMSALRTQHLADGDTAQARHAAH